MALDEANNWLAGPLDLAEIRTRIESLTFNQGETQYTLHAATDGRELYS